MGLPEHLDEPLTPPQAEFAVKRATNKVAAATSEFRRAGDELVAAKIAYRKAVVGAAFDPECPVPRRGEVTVGEREAWINQETALEKDLLFAAEIARETAIEALRSARTEHQGAMAINASVREAYRLLSTNQSEMG